jgi:anti-sigma regulatory factor (Ser/Thr protein kinase)
MGHASTSWSYNFSLAPTERSVGVARRLIQACLFENELGLLADDVELVTSEFATNAVVHASSRFDLRLVRATEQVWLTVRHKSKGAPVADSTSFMKNKARGLVILRSCASDWGVTNGWRNTRSVWAVFEVGPRSSPVRAADEQGTSVS